MKLIVGCVVGGLLLLAGPHLLNADHPVVKPTRAPVSSSTVPMATTSPPSTAVTSTAVTSTVATVGTTTTTMVVPTTLVPVDTQEVTFPITQVLPLESPNWRIDYRIDGAGHLSLVITLITFLNRADQVAERRAQLVEHKAEALAALLERGGVGPNAYPIKWLPADAASL